MNNGTDTPIGVHSGVGLRPSTLLDLLRWRALHQGDQLAYVFLADGEGSESRLTYAELDGKARAVAVSLLQKAAGGERALLLYPPGLDFLAAFFGCLYAGVAAIPAYPPDPARLNRSLPRLRAIAKDARVAAILTTSEIFSTAKLLFAHAPDLQSLNWLASDAVAPEAADDWREPGVDGGSIAFLQYTSGSTGTPKGVMLDHRNLLHNASLVYHALEHTAADRYVSWLPTFHDMGFMAGVLQPLYAGIPVIQMAPLAFLQSPVRWLQAITRHGGTTSGGPNFAYDLCVRSVTPEQKEALDLSTWTVAFNGAEPIRPETLERFARAFEPCGFRRETFYPCYGLAEATLIVSGGRKADVPVVGRVQAEPLERHRVVEAAGEEGAQTYVGCGQVLGDQKVLIVNPETSTRCAPDEVGEIWVAGGSVACGYWNRPEETGETFGARLADTGEGPFLRTGDLGFLRGGELHIAGRLKDLIIVRGRNLYPQDIELAVERSHRALRPGCGAAFSVEAGGEERLVVVQEVDTRKQLDFDEIFRKVRQTIAEEFQVQVHALALIEPKSIAKTSSGKIQRRATRAGFLKGELSIVGRWVAGETVEAGGSNAQANEPETGAGAKASAEAAPEAASPAPGETPRAETFEGWLVSELAARSGVEAASIDREQPITQYGLDSLAAVEIAHAIEMRWGIRLPMAALFEDVSVAQLAERALPTAAPTRGATAESRGGDAAGGPAANAELTAAEHPLSYGQRALWFLHRLAPESAAYNIVFAARLRQRLDVSALRRAFQSLVDRHAALRTTFEAPEGEPVRRVYRQMEVCFRVEDAAGWGDELLDRRLAEEAHRPFSLEHGPLLRIHLFTRSNSEHVLLLTVHHIVCDMWSLAVMVEELGALYAPGREGAGAELPPLALDYDDFARRQRLTLEGPEGERLWGYWREQLGGTLPVLELPTDRPRPPVQTYSGASHAFKLDAELSGRLRSLARAEGVTLYSLLLASFQVLLSRYAGQEEVLVGSPASGRQWGEWAGQVGYYVNPLVLRARCESGLSFKEFLGRTGRAVVAALEHQEFPFPLLVERLQPGRGAGHSPLFQVMFILQQTHLKKTEAAPFALGETGARMAVGELAFESLALEQRASQFDLTLMAAEVEGGLATSWQYNTDLFDAATVERMAGHFGALLEAVAADPGRALAAYTLLTGAESREQFVAWNDTRAEYPEAETIDRLFERQASLTPEAPAVEFRGESLSYRELNERANRLARHLRSLGFGREQLAGVLMERSVEMVVGLLGILKAGGAYLPLDPAYPRERLAFMLEDARPHVLLTRGRGVPEGLSTAGARVVDLLADAEEFARRDADDLARETSPDGAAYVIYTSGSTGTPKGVVGLHRGAVNRFHWMWQTYPFAPGEVCCQKTSLSFVDSVWEVFGPLLSGVKVVLVPDETTKDPRRLVEHLAACGATRIVVVPSLLRVLLESHEDLARRLPRLKYWVTSGEALPRELAQLFAERLPQAALINLYGSSEVAADVTSYEARAEDACAAVPIGRPIANSRAYLLDANLRPVPAGLPGELYVGGVQLARGYLNRPALTAERFIPDPFSAEPGARLYRTGDRARYRRDGEIEFLGRADNQVKVRGFRIELGEVEAALKRHESVTEAVVVAREESPGDCRLTAYVVACGGAAPASSDLRGFARESLPEYMVPSAFVVLDRLPLTPNGKVDRKALPAARANEANAPAEVAAEAAAPRSEMERALARVWGEVLGLDTLRVTDNFFDLGGHSLLLVRLQSKLREATGLDVPVVTLFQYPSVESLAKYLTRGDAQSVPAARAAARRGRGADEMHDGRIAIVGMSGRFPGADDLETFWRNLRHGVESISFFTDQELAELGVPRRSLADRSFVRAGAPLREPGLFDAAFFGYSPREAELMDPQHRVFLECAWHALENAGYDAARYDGLVGVYAGTSLSTYLLFNLAPHTGLLDSEDGFQVMLGNDKDFLTTRVSYKLDLKGPSLDIQTACSTSLVAIHAACESLNARRCDMALAGGVSVQVPQRSGYFYQPEGILSPDGHCRAFDAEGRGTIFGSGAGVVLLKRLEDALRDGDHVHAVIRATAVNNDGAGKVGYTAPGVDGQANVIAEALAAAGIEAGEVSYVEAHGTATQLGDPVEIEALKQAFGGAAAGSCRVGSVKTNIGHLDAAAGVAGLIKTALALRHREIPPSLHFEKPNPRIDFESSPFRVNASLAPWESTGSPRRAGVSSFGVGGTNAHAVLEEAPAAAESSPSRDAQLLLLSARTPAALERMAGNLCEHLRRHADLSMADAAYTLQVGRREFDYRLMLVARGREEAVRLLESRDARVLGNHAEPGRREVVFMFPGQGAQQVNMGRSLYEGEAEFRRRVDECAELLGDELGLDLREVLFPAPGEEEKAGRRLRETQLTQPALFAVEYALARLWMSWGVRPSAMIGHSVGEYVAACLAGVMGLEDALRLVAVRGRLMQGVERGAMLAVALSEEEAERRLTGGLSLAAVNAPQSCVVSGEAAAVEELEGRLAAEGVMSRRLQTSHAFHSPMMEPVVGRFVEEVKRARLAPPRIPYLSNVTGGWVTEAEATDPAYYGRHLRERVRFAAGAGELLREGRRVLLEVGPGQSLCALVKQQLAGGAAAREKAAPAVVASLGDRAAKDEGEQLAGALGKLWLARVEVDWKLYYEGERRRRVELPPYPFERQRFWVDPPAEGDALSKRAGVEKRADVSEWFYAPSWKQGAAPRAALADASGGAERASWLLFLDGRGLGALLAEGLRRGGQRVVCVRAGREFASAAEDEFVIDPRAADDYRRLLDALRAGGRLPNRIVHLWGVGPRAEDSSPFERFGRAQEFGFYSLISMMQAFGEATAAAPLKCWVVTEGLHAVESGDEARPECATVLGACKVIPQEYQHVTCRALDVAAPRGGGEEAALAGRLLAEVLADKGDAVVAYRGRRRWVQHYEPLPLGEEAAAPAALRERGVYLITGGLGHVGLLVAEHLARGVRARLVLTARSPLPPREEWEALLASGADDEVSRKVRRVLGLEELGAEVLVLSADAASADEMRAALARSRERFGVLHGVFHAAGAVGEKAMKLVAEVGRADCEAHFAAKARGLYVLSELVREEGADFCLLFSSNTAVLGGLGSAAYAAANLFMDAFALDPARGEGARWLSVNWDGWLLADDGRVSASHQTGIDRYGMTPGEGIEALGRLLAAAPAGQVVVSTGDLDARLKLWIEKGGEAGADEAGACAQLLHPRPSLAAAYVAPATHLERTIARVWQELLGIEQVGLHDNFFDLGGNSLIGLKVIARLKSELQVEIPAVRLFEGPTVGALAQLVGEPRGQEEGRAQDKSRSRGERRRDRVLRKTPAGA